MLQRHPSQWRHRQEGGVTIIVALIMLVVMSVAAFGLSRNVLRELAITGTVTQGAKAAEAADAGLDWFIVWSHPDNQPVATSVTGNKLLSQKLDTLTAANWTQTDATLPAWDRAFRLVSNDTDMSGSDMVFDNTNTTIFKQASVGNVVIQKFNLTVRFLGFQPVTQTGGGGQAAGGTNPTALSSQDLGWQVVSEGDASIPLGGGTYRRFVQRREMIGLQALAQK